MKKDKPLRLELTKTELKLISKEMEKLENEASRQFRHLNGGFAEAQMYDYDEYEVHIELKFGAQDDTGSVVYTEEYTWDRETKKLND